MTIVSHFLKWIDTARVSERAAAASALAHAYVGAGLSFEDRCAAEAALTLLLDDSSSKVRQAMAEALSMSHHAPVQVIAALASDQPEVAAFVLARSPLLTDADLIDRVAISQKATQVLIAGRPTVSMALAAAIAEIGDEEACAALLANSGAAIASLSYRRMAERHGHLPALREALIADPRLPADCRHMLLVKLGETLKSSPLVLALMGAARAERVMRDACVKASLTLIENVHVDEHAALIEHLRLCGGDDAVVVLGVLEIILREDGIAGRKRIARERDVLLGDMRRRATDFDVRPRTLEAAHQRILRFAVVIIVVSTAATTVLLSLPHGLPFTLVDILTSTRAHQRWAASWILRSNSISKDGPKSPVPYRL